MSAGQATTLWHFTCAHGAVAIGRRGVLQPHPQPVLGGMPLIWFTSDPFPARDDVGLSSVMLRCDRMEHRYRATDTTGCFPWLALADDLDPRTVAMLSADRAPATWWVARTPVPAVAS